MEAWQSFVELGLATYDECIIKEIRLNPITEQCAKVEIFLAARVLSYAS